MRSSAPSATTATSVAQASPAAFAYLASAGRWTPAEHLLRIDKLILAGARGELQAQGKVGAIVTLPPRHGKSELISRHGPAWFVWPSG